MTDTTRSEGAPAIAEPGDVVVSPYLHVDPDRVFDPMTNRSLTHADDLFAPLQAAALRDVGAARLDATVRQRLLDAGWLVAAGEDLSRRSYLKVVSLETNTVCNQACYFCPVSIAPRDEYAMPDTLFDSILEQLLDYRATLEGIFLHSYNEPTVDPRFVEHHSRILKLGLPAAVATNGSGLTPKRVDALLGAGTLRYLGVNFSTLDREQYAKDRGRDHAAVVTRNLDYLSTVRLAHEMKILVFGTGDAAHEENFRRIRERYDGSTFTVESEVVMDRAGHLEIGARPAHRVEKLRGCTNIGSRPIHHLHITPRGECVVCCEDYDEKYVVGDLRTSTVAEVLAGPELAKMRRWIYGVEEAPDDFICRGCIFARSGD